MVSRYYFHAVNSHETIVDDTGIETDDIEAAIDQAASVIKEMVAAGELDDAEGHWHLEIKDAAGDTVKRLTILAGD